MSGENVPPERGMFTWEDDDGHRAHGVGLPDGTVVMQWDLESWPQEERLLNEHISIYGSVGDVLHANGGKIEWGTWHGVVLGDVASGDAIADGGTDIGTPPDDRRYRVVCDACDFESRGNYGNRLVAGAEAERHDERAHGGEQSAEVESVRSMTDGGQLQEPDESDDVDDDRVDPENLPSNATPAYVQVRGQGPVYVADYMILDSGWVRVREWPDDIAKLPPHRVQAIRNVQTEHYGERGESGYRAKRVADEEEREYAKDTSARLPGTVTTDG